MTKAELIAEVSILTGIQQSDVRETVEAVFQVIKRGVKNGEGYYHRGFGSFTKKPRAQKTGRNIGKGTPLIIPAHNIPHFKPAPGFNQEVKGGGK